jgi:hypothetical protein
MTIWLRLQWYPLSLLMYYGGISALASRNYRSLASLLTRRPEPVVTAQSSREVIVPTARAVRGLRGEKNPLEVQRE